jgi:hypothetical protein
MWSLYLRLPHQNSECTSPLMMIMIIIIIVITIIIILVTTTINLTNTVTIIIAENVLRLRYWLCKNLSRTTSKFLSSSCLELLPHIQYRIRNVPVCLWSVSLPNFAHYAHMVLKSANIKRRPKKIVLPPLLRFQIRQKYSLIWHIFPTSRTIHHFRTIGKWR